MSKHLEISIGLFTWLRQSVAIKGAADRCTGFPGDLLHGARVSDAVEKQRMNALLSDLLGETR